MPYVRLAEDGQASLRGSRCTQCNTVLIGEPRACSACGALAPKPITLAEEGHLHTWTVVYRSFPGVRTPFVAGVVDLKGGGTLKGTLFNVEPDPKALRPGLPVRVVFSDSGQRDERGRPFITYSFVPMQDGL